MGWDTEGTKRKILEAAVSEFSEHGPDGTTIEKIAKISKVNKERIYNYFGSKYELFETIIYNELANATQVAPLASALESDLAEYASQVFDYHQQHPELSRLLLWEGLVFNKKNKKNSNNKEYRRRNYTKKVQAIKSAQMNDLITHEVEAEYLAFIILVLANSWFMLPQVTDLLLPEGDIGNQVKKREIIKTVVNKILSTHGN
jgi:AcrR family transcriptional regulator